jgi:hypothetical protein
MEASTSPTSPTSPTRPGTGWAAFAGMMILIAGSFNIIWGIVAVTDDYFSSANLIFWNLDAWGWVHIVLGALQIVTALLIFSGSTMGAVLGITFAFFNAIGALLDIGAFPVWSVIILVLDGLIIYALTVYGDAFRTS